MTNIASFHILYPKGNPFDVNTKWDWNSGVLQISNCFVLQALAPAGTHVDIYIDQNLIASGITEASVQAGFSYFYYTFANAAFFPNPYDMFKPYLAANYDGTTPGIIAPDMPKINIGYGIHTIKAVFGPPVSRIEAVAVYVNPYNSLDKGAVHFSFTTTDPTPSFLNPTKLTTSALYDRYSGGVSIYGNFLMLSGILPGTYSYTAEFDGYNTVNGTFTIIAGDTASVNIDNISRSARNIRIEVTTQNTGTQAINVLLGYYIDSGGFSAPYDQYNMTVGQSVIRTYNKTATLGTHTIYLRLWKTDMTILADASKTFTV